MSTQTILRAVLFVALLLALAAGAHYDARDAAILRLRSDWHRAPGDWAARAAPREGRRDPRPGTAEPARLADSRLIVRTAAAPPGAAELEALAVLAAHGPLLAVRPRDARLVLRIEPPHALLTGRSAALGFELRGSPGATQLVTLHDEAGPVDSMRAGLDAAGRAAGAFRLRPVRSGWQEWRVEAGAGAARTTGGWVAEAGLPRVLVAAGPPDWESRFLLRSLDEAGARVEAVLPLGRGLHAGDAGTRLSADSATLAAFDVVIVLPGAELGQVERRALSRFVAAGGGLLAVGRPDLWGELGLGEGSAEATLDAAALRWQAPAELTALPAAELRSAVLPVGAPPPVAHAVASAEQRVLLALRGFGYGRAAALGLLETWRWRMEAGHVVEHREFWRGLVDWLAGGSAPDPRVWLAADRGTAGSVVAVAVESERASPSLRLVRPDGSSEMLAPVQHAAAPASFSTAFVPVDTGVHRLVGPDDEVRATYRAIAEELAAGDDAVARLALLAYASGGAMLAADSIERRLDDWRAAHDVPADRAWRWLLLAALFGAAMSEWTLRRLRGRP